MFSLRKWLSTKVPSMAGSEPISRASEVAAALRAAGVGALPPLPRTHPLSRMNCRSLSIQYAVLGCRARWAARADSVCRAPFSALVVVGGWSGLPALLQAVGVVEEVVDSQVDVRDCVVEVLSPFGVRMLSSVLKWNVELLSVQQPATLDSVRGSAWALYARVCV